MTTTYYPVDIYETIRMYKLEGMTRQQAIEEYERKFYPNRVEPWILAIIFQVIEP